MSEEIYLQVEDAIRRKLHLGRWRDHWPGPGITWDRPVKIENGDIYIVSSDCGQDWDAYPITTDEWSRRVSQCGLFKRVGIWNFTPADDPAADDIRRCEQNPSAAGAELYWLRQRVAELEKSK